MIRFPRLKLLAACMFTVAALTFVGCAPSGPELGTVHGLVTLDGKPLSRATLTFQPESEGSPSIAETQEDGTYVLYYTDRPGALVDTHTIRITTKRQISTDEGGGFVPEKVPPKYNRETGLSKKVEADDNEINFELTSK